MPPAVALLCHLALQNPTAVLQSQHSSSLLWIKAPSAHCHLFQFIYQKSITGFNTDAFETFLPSSTQSGNWSFSSNFCFLSTDHAFSSKQLFFYLTEVQLYDDNKVEYLALLAFMTNSHGVRNRVQLSHIALGKAMHCSALAAFKVWWLTGDFSTWGGRWAAYVIINSLSVTSCSPATSCMDSQCKARIPTYSCLRLHRITLGTQSLKSKNFFDWNLENLIS